jgi:Kef-type K+ transport system membrane component KefB
MDGLIIVMGLSLLVILSYFFRILANRFKIPSVLLLIITGIILFYVLQYLGVNTGFRNDAISILGFIGLVIIILEGAFDLNVSREKIPLITKSFLSALLILSLSVAVIGGLLYLFIQEEIYKCFIYAIPLSIVSSAIVVASSDSISPDKKEFIIYESTFSDILGVMFFEYFLLEVPQGQSYALAVISNFGFTVLLSVIIALVLIYLFQKINTKIKFFLVLSILAFLFAFGKFLHLSSLLLVFIFGLILNNHRVFLRGFMERFYNMEKLDEINESFHTIVLETAFLIGTFFFIVFGMTINLKELFNIKVIIIGTLILAGIYAIRWIVLYLFQRQKISLHDLFLAPRGLITVMLFYKIPFAYHLKEFDKAIISFVVIMSVLLMAVGLMLPEPSLEKEPVEDAENLLDEDNTGDDNSSGKDALPE